MGRLDGKVAVVTGGANGIGRACCERFAEEGADVVIADVTDAAGAETAAAVEALGRKAAYLHADAADPDATDALMQVAVDAMGTIDILVTAAGISHAGYRSGDPHSERKSLSDGIAAAADPARAFLEMPVADWTRVLDVNLTGTLLAVQAAGRRMVEQGRGGAIVTLSSVAAKRPEAGPVAYSVSKAGVWMLTKQAARLLGPAGIRVNAIGPGWIDTNMTAVLRQIPEARERLIAGLPLGRTGTPREVANTALFLASEEASYFTGELIHPDGGMVTD